MGLGFALVGVAPAQPSAYTAQFESWLSSGQHGQMTYLAQHVNVRLDPRVFVRGARSIICVADRYPSSVTPGDTAQLDLGHGKTLGRIARYAWGDDYHRVIKKRLFRLADTLRDAFPDHTYRVAVDTAPILEREHAGRAALGWVGKHTLLIHPKLGSWLLLGQIVTTLPIASGSHHDQPMTDHCGTCTRCVDACPTNCITPYSLDAKRCISYLTIEHRGPIDADLHPAMGNWIAGCDVCQEVCPYNHQGPVGRTSPPGGPGYDAAYTTRPPGPAIALSQILTWDGPARQKALRGSALKRIKLDMFKRNALIAAGNHLAHCENTTLQGQIQRLAQDPRESELVRVTAKQVLDRLGQQGHCPRPPRTTAGDASASPLNQVADRQRNLPQCPDDNCHHQTVQQHE